MTKIHLTGIRKMLDDKNVIRKNKYHTMLLDLLQLTTHMNYNNMHII